MTVIEKNSYTVVARRYRPRTFGDLVGQNHIVAALSNAIQQNRVGHAYLFTGARGTGKTSSARIFAKCLNCVSGPTSQPCDQCDICNSIASGEDVDVLEIDGASNRGIEEIRQLRSNVNIRPSRSRYKIYIIDEVHMLTKEAFNALLKTLEEPPPHVKFIFCTTDPQKIPITVLSRCQRFDFMPVANSEITKRLGEIVQNEGLQAEDSALQLIARRAAGSMRDSQSLLEQLLAFCDQKLTVQDVHAVLGTVDTSQVFLIGEAIFNKQPAEVLRLVESAVNAGCDPGQLATQLVVFLRDLMVARVGGPAGILLQVEESEFERLVKLGQSMGLDILLSTLQIIDQATVRMQHSMHARILLESALLRACELENLQSLTALLSKTQIRQDESPQGQSPAKTGIVKSSAPVPEVFTSDPKKKGDLKGPETIAFGDSQEIEQGSVNFSGQGPQTRANSIQNSAPASVESSFPTNRQLSTANSPHGIDQPIQLWRAVLADLGDLTADVAGDFRKVEFTAPDALLVTMSADYQVQLCNRPERRQKVEECLAKLAGRRIRIDFAASAPEPNLPRGSATVVNRRQQIKKLEQHPLVQTVIATFDGEVIDFELARDAIRKRAQHSFDPNRELSEVE